MNAQEIAAGLQKRIDATKAQLTNCERMMELLKPEWELFEARTGHNVYVTRDYVDHLSAARKHREDIGLFEAAVRQIIQEQHL